MDEEDSQDELINRSTSQSKGKRAAVWAISDDSDDFEESDDGESDGVEEEEEEEEEEGEDHMNGDDDEEEEEDNEEDDDEEELEDGAVGGTSADLEVLSSDEDADKCPICLNSFGSQPVATPESCEHYFCFDCILEWAKNANSCPVDRLAFNSIYLRKCYGGKVKKMITVQKPVKEGQEETVDLSLEQTNCEVCGGSDREDRLLLCDGCDAGYHMECLTPPLNAVPVEEWFCPECRANNRLLRNSAEEVSEPSTARPATSRSQPRAAGPTRAIARTQQSERVRANVNRHRITQARTSQLAPTYLIQSTWLDETINAVVAGLNTAVYVRDFTPRAPSSRRRKTVRRRKVRSKKTSSAQGKNGKATSTGVKRRKRRVKRTNSRRKKAIKKIATARSRIASNLGIVKDKKNSSLPTVYRPAEHTLSSMRADIGAASLSIYGDPFDLDPFTDRQDDEEQTRVTSLLEAKRRGISRSALRSHQPVARPVTASLSRDVGVAQSRGVVEAAPVPDLLGSILSGQSMLLMDSSDVVINRDGSLKATKPVASSLSVPVSRLSRSSTDTSTLVSPVSSSSLGESSMSLHHNGALPGPSSRTRNRDFPPSSLGSPPFMASPPNHTQATPHSDLPPRRLPPHPARPTTSPAHWGTNGVGPLRESSSSAIHPTPDKRKEAAQSQSQSKKAPTKPMWVDVSVLPRIPKIKRDGSVSTHEGTSQRGISDRSGRGSGSNSSTVSNGQGMNETGTNSVSGDKGRQHSVDQQKSQVDGRAQRHRPEGAGSSSSSFSNSFSSASSSTGHPTNHSLYSSNPSSSSSSSVSFRINSSGNSWHSRRLSIASSSSSGDSKQGNYREEEDEARKRRLRRDKQMLLASRMAAGMEQENDMYDPFNPTLSDSSSSDNEAESTSLTSSSQSASSEGKPRFLNAKVKEENGVQVKLETEQIEVSPEQSRTAVPEVVRCSADFVKVEKESTVTNIKAEKLEVALNIKIKEEPESDDENDSERCDNSVTSCINSEANSTPPAHHSLAVVKTERDIKKENSEQSSATRIKDEPSASSSASNEKNLKEERKSDSAPASKSPSRDSHQNKRPSKPPKEQCSISSETDRSKRGDHHSTGRGGRRKEKDKERSSRRSPSGERRRARSASSDSSQPGSTDRTQRKRRRSRSRSKDNSRRRRSRSASSSSSREHSRRKRHRQRSKDRDDGRERDHERRRPSKDKRRSRSKSRSKSRSRSRSKDRRRSRSKSRSRSRERRKDHARQQHSSHSSRDKMESRPRDRRRPRSRSGSRERRKNEASSKSSQKTSGSCVSSSKDTKQSQDKNKVKDVTRSSVRENKVPEVKKQKSPSSASAVKVKKEEKVVADSLKTDLSKEIKLEKDLKKVKPQCLDMFEDSPSITPIKKEEIDTTPLAVSADEKTQTTVKTEPCEVAIIKREPDGGESCPLAPVTPPSTLAVKSESEQTLSASVSPSVTSTTQQNAAESTVPVKEAAQQPSDSEEDFNVDVMLDSLDYVKSEPPEGSGTALKQEKEAPPASTLAGTKTKTQVKRVTWNIQEPEGPQPEKSASKLALYKLKLKQEGARRPSLAAQTSSQDVSGTVTDPSTKGPVGPSSTSSHSDGHHPEALPTSRQTECDEGDLSRKDKYLKKLHMQERAVEEVKLAIKPFYQRRDINKDEYKDILRKAVQKVCHSKSGEINPVKVGNLVKAYVDKYKHARKHRKEDDSGKAAETQPEAMQISDSP